MSLIQPACRIAGKVTLSTGMAGWPKIAAGPGLRCAKPVAPHLHAHTVQT
jgi:hypothetical protein